MVKFTPIGKKFLVKQINAPTESRGGIIISVKQSQDIYEGTVVKIGTGYRTDPSPLSVGDRVLLTKWTKVDELKTEDDNFMIIDADSVIAKIKE